MHNLYRIASHLRLGYHYCMRIVFIPESIVFVSAKVAQLKDNMKGVEWQYTSWSLSRLTKRFNVYCVLIGSLDG